MQNTQQTVVGRVLRATTRGFACGTHSRNVGTLHDFGAFVRVPVANDGACCVIGLIYAVEIKDDQLVNELVMADGIDPNVLQDQRENRMVPVEIDVLNIGYGYRDGRGLVVNAVHSLPPRPPMSLSEVVLCSPSEICAFTERFDFFRLVLHAADVPSEDLLATALRFALDCRAPDERESFRIAAGRHLAKLLTTDLRRLSNVLALLM